MKCIYIVLCIIFVGFTIAKSTEDSLECDICTILITSAQQFVTDKTDVKEFKEIIANVCAKFEYKIFEYVVR